LVIASLSTVRSTDLQGNEDGLISSFLHCTEGIS
jgi:hypothetical protein